MVSIAKKKRLIVSINLLAYILERFTLFDTMSPFAYPCPPLFAYPSFWGQKWANCVKHYKCRGELNDEKKPKHTWASA